MKECNTCIHYENASRYDPSEPNELYTLMKCNLHGHVTDWPCVCDDWEGVDELMESIEKLRELAADMNCMEIIDHLDEAGKFMFHTEWLDSWHKAFDATCDKIEREIAERYMLLPVDADGETIHVGDVLESDAFGRIEVEGFVHNAVVFWSCDPQPARLAAYPCNLMRHVKPRTIEDVLNDCFRNSAGITTEEREELVAKYADEIRQLMGGDAE